MAPGPGEEQLQLVAVLDGDDLPARRGEHALDAEDPDVGDHPVERLAVHVDDPDDLAQLGHHRVDDRLPAGPLVELGVAEQRVLAAGAADVAGHVGPEVMADVAACDRTPYRRGGADADRAGGVVGRVRVLRAARVGLQAAQFAQPGQVGRVKVAEQVIDRVQHRRRVRLDRHPVLAAQVAEPQRGHDRRHGCAGRLVAADLEPARVWPHLVGVVDDRGRQPERTLLDGAKHREPLAVGGRRGVGAGHSAGVRGLGPRRSGHGCHPRRTSC